MHVEGAFASCVNPHMATESSVAARAKALRKQRGLTQDDVARRAMDADPTFRRDYVTKVEGGQNKATSAKIRTGLARAYGVDPAALGEYLDGQRSLDDLVRGSTAPVEKPAAQETHAPRIFISTGPTPFEHALGEAFKQGGVDLRDVDKVREIMGKDANKLPPGEDLVFSARAWILAVHRMLALGEEINYATLAYETTARFSPRLAAEIEERSKKENDRGDAELRAHGGEPPSKPILRDDP